MSVVVASQEDTRPRSLLKRERKLGSNWLSFYNLEYCGFFFDFLAVNLKTKQIEIVLHYAGSERRKRFAGSLGNVTILDSKTGPAQPVLDALGDPVRVRILELLNENPLYYTDICTGLGLDPQHDAGRFVYHLRTLTNAGLIGKFAQNTNSQYQVTRLGRSVLRLIKQIVQSQFDKENPT